MERVTAVIVAGGHGRRFGGDKALAPLCGAPLAQHVARRLALVAQEIVVVRAAGQPDLPLSIPVPLHHAHDVVRAAGPLGGIVTAMRARAADWYLVAAADLPLAPAALFRALLAHARASGRAAVLPAADGLLEPLCAAYRRDCLPAVERALIEGRLKTTAFLDEVSWEPWPEVEWRRCDPSGRAFRNINTRADLDALEAECRAARTRE